MTTVGELAGQLRAALGTLERTRHAVEAAHDAVVRTLAGLMPILAVTTEPAAVLVLAHLIGARDRLATELTGLDTAIRRTRRCLDQP